MSEFRDAITDAIPGTFTSEPGDDELIGDAILAMPEMEAIRAWLRSDAMNWCCGECRNAALAVNGVPQNVIDWVLKP